MNPFHNYGPRKVEIRIDEFESDPFYKHTLLRMYEPIGTNALYDMIRWEDGKVSIWRQEEGCMHCEERFKISIGINDLKALNEFKIETGYCSNPKYSPKELMELIVQGKKPDPLICKPGPYFICIDKENIEKLISIIAKDGISA